MREISTEREVSMNYHEVEKKIIQTYGIHAQSLIACEELAELIQAISKTIRGGHGTDNLIEEIADSEIMIEQLEIFYGIDRKKIDEVKRYKLERQLKRIEATETQKREYE